MRFQQLEDAADALAERLEHMIPEPDDRVGHTMINMVQGGLFAGMDIDPVQLGMLASVLTEDTGALVAAVIAKDLELRPERTIDVFERIARSMTGCFVIGYCLGRLHDPEGGS